GAGRDEERRAARDEVDAGGDHRRGVDERRHRRGSLHRVRQPRVQRELRGLARRADEEGDADEQQVRLRGDADLLEDLGVGEGPEDEEDRDHPDRVAPVADAVHPERLVRGLLRRGLVEPEPDQEIRAQADTLPPHEREEVVVGHDQDEHREHEERQPREEAVEAVVVLHVAVRVDEDQRADDGDDQEHRARQRIDERRDVHVEVAHADPLVERHGRALLAAEDFEEHADGEDGGGGDRGGRDPPGGVTQPAAAEETVDEERREREGRDEPDVGDHGYPFIAWISSTSTVGRLRYAESTIARPTATSAAAMTKMNTTNTLPRSSGRPARREKATSARFVAFSMSSTHMRMTTALRRTSTPATPMKNSTADTATNAPTGTLIALRSRFGLPAARRRSFVVPPHEDDGADHRREEQHRGDLEREREVAEDARRERRKVAATGRGLAAVAEGEGEQRDRDGDRDDDERRERGLLLEEERVRTLPLRREHDSVEDEDGDRADVDQDLERGDGLRPEQDEHPSHAEERERHQQGGRGDAIDEHDPRGATDDADGEQREERG